LHCADIRVRVANPGSKSLVQINSYLSRGEIGVCRRAVCLLGRIAPLGTQREPRWCCLTPSAGITTRMGSSGCTTPVPNQDKPPRMVCTAINTLKGVWGHAPLQTHGIPKAQGLSAAVGASHPALPSLLLLCVAHLWGCARFRSAGAMRGVL